MSRSPGRTATGGHHRVSGRSPVGRRLLQVGSAALSATLLLASGYFWLTYRNVDQGLTRLDGVRVGKPAAGGSGGAEQVVRKDQNLLLVGNDDRSNMTRAEQEDLHVGPGDGSRATDTMMVVHVPADGSRATLISLPRDSFVDIPGHGRDKLNSAFVSGYNDAAGTERAKITAGANLLIDTITNLTGLTIDRYVQIGLLGFYRLANALDGVPVTLCADVDDPKSGFHMSKGKHTLNGKQALQFVRQRYNFPDGRGDLDRVRRQQYFLTAAFREVASANILLRLNQLGDVLRTSLFLDAGFKIFDLARQVENLTANNIRGATIPTEFATIDGQDVLRVSPEKVKRYVAELLAPPAPATPAPTTAATPTAPAPSPSATVKSPDRRCTY